VIEMETQQKDNGLAAFAAGAGIGFAISTALVFSFLSLTAIGTLAILVGMVIGAICALVSGYSFANRNKLRIGLYCAVFVIAVWLFIFLLVTPTQRIVT
jgi:hypothetical protein